MVKIKYPNISSMGGIPSNSEYVKFLRTGGKKKKTGVQLLDLIRIPPRFLNMKTQDKTVLDKVGGTKYVQYGFSTATIASASGNQAEYKTLLNLSGIYDSAMSDEISRIIFQNAEIEFHAYHVKPFRLAFVLFRAEAGATITSPTESSSAIPLKVMEDACVGDFTPFISNYVTGRMFMDNGTCRFIATTTFKFTSFIQSHYDKESKFELEQESLRDLELGVIVFTDDDGVSLSYYNRIEIYNTTATRRINF